MRLGRTLATFALGLASFVPLTALAQDEDLSEEELEALAAEDPSLAALITRPELRTGTGVVGRVLATDIDGPIIEGQVVVVETNARALTNVDGYYAIDLPPGTYTLRVFYQLYRTARIANVEVRAGEAATVDVELDPDSSAVEEEFVVEARADTNSAATQLQVRRRSTDVRDAISAEEISRAGDSAASSAARRVVAATVYQDYLYVRGLGGRYTTVLLDDTPLPQLDPSAPGVQLDLFPASVLSSVSILKTYTPGLPGSFAGGTMLLATRAYPEDLEASASISYGVNTETTFQRVPRYSGGGLDFLGVDDGTRAMPADVPRAQLLMPGESLERDEVDRIGATFSDGFGVYDVPAPPSVRLGVGIGDRVDLGGHPLGYYITVGYSTQHQARRETSATTTGGGTNRYERFSDVAQVRLSSLGTTSLELDRGHEITLTGFVNQSADDYASRDTGFEVERGVDFYRQRQRWLQRTVALGRLSGDHQVDDGGLRFRWRGHVVYGGMGEPDTRDFFYGRDEDGSLQWAGRVLSDGQRLYFDYDEVGYGGGADLGLPLGPVTVRAGGAIHLTESSYSARRFGYRVNSRFDDTSVYGLGPNSLFASENAGGPWRLLETTNVENDAFAASEALLAAHLSGEAEITDWLRVMGGARVESFRQTIEPRSFVDQEEVMETGTARTDVDALPAVSAVVTLTEQMYVRAGYSSTVARPRIRELSGSTYVDYERNRNLFGSPTVQRTQIHSFDLRWELFPGTDEVLAVSGFMKLFEQPIELVLLDDNRTVSFQNIEGATNFGAEIEARIGLGRLTDALEAFQIGANLTLVYSRAELSDAQKGIATSDERPLAGQSPWVANASIGFVPPNAGFRVFLLYNVYGERLDEVGVDPLPDTYEQPFHALDATVEWTVHENVTLRGTVQNLLFSRWRTTGQIERSYDPGLTVSLGLTWDT